MCDKRLQSAINHAWFEKFSCIGGACPANCCQPKLWKILITEKEVEAFRSYEGDFAEELRRCLDFEKKAFKSREEVFGKDVKNPEGCALLTEEGLCKVVLNCGEGLLTEICRDYPRSMRLVNDTIIQYVDVSCPEVAGYLFDNDPVINNYIDDIPFIVNTPAIDKTLFSAVKDAVRFLQDLFLNVEGYEAGKCFILFDIINMLQDAYEKGDLSDDNLRRPLEKYASDDVIISVLSECEKFNEDIDRKVSLARMALEIFKPELVQIPYFLKRFVPDLESHLDAWINTDELETDLIDFYEYRDANWPRFIDRYMAYRTFILGLGISDIRIASEIKAGYVTVFLDEVVAMSCWKTNNKRISIKEYSLIISEIERRIFHSNSNHKMLVDNTKVYEDGLKFSLFLLPVY